MNLSVLLPYYLQVAYFMIITSIVLNWLLYGKLTRFICDSNWLSTCLFTILATLLVFTNTKLCGTAVKRFFDGKVRDYIWIFVAFNNFPFGWWQCTRLEFIFIFIELEIKTLLWSPSWLWLRLQNGETTTRSRCVFLLSLILILFKSFNFLFYIGGCSDLRHFSFNLISATALGWSLWPRII